MARKRALFRAAIYPFVEFWWGGPGLNIPVARFGLWTAFPLVQGSQSEQPAWTVCSSLLVPEIPYSILPYGVCQGFRIAYQDEISPEWQGQPIPRWRGVTCRMGTVQVRLISEVANEPPQVPSLLVLLPDSDPPGPRPDSVLIGSQFPRHYGMSLVVNYSAIQ
jgi:hypothetical protein